MLAELMIELNFVVLFCFQSGYLKTSARRHSDTWKPIPTCTNVWTMHCVFSRATVYTGTFFLRVQASDGNDTSFWSEEKFIASQNYSKPTFL